MAEQKAETNPLEKLRIEYNDYVRQYKTKKTELEKAGNNRELADSARLELKSLAQRSLGKANALISLYEDLRFGVEPGKPFKFQIDFDFIKEQQQKFIKEIEGLGSSMSGIPNTTFDDVAGLEDVKSAIKDYLFALQNPELAKKYRIDTNIGLLLYGPPGTGKTLVAEAIANALGVRFFVITPSSVFGSYVGESERNIKEIFAELRACEEGSVLLIDECESIFAKRSGDSNSAAIGVANQLLQEMNGAKDSANEKRVIIGATNRPQLVDEAYLRYKRFSLHFYIGMPAPEAVEKVIKSKVGKLPHVAGLEEQMIKYLANEKYTCADVSNIIAQCASRAMQELRLMTGGRVTKDQEPVKIGMNHFQAVMSRFTPSVSPTDLIQYDQFKNRTKN